MTADYRDKRTPLFAEGRRVEALDGIADKLACSTLRMVTNFP
jgi:hypothetical protein